MKKNYFLKQMEAIVFTIGVFTLADVAYNHIKTHMSGRKEEEKADALDFLEDAGNEAPARMSCYDTCIWREEDEKGGCFCTKNTYNAFKNSVEHGFCGRKEDSLDESTRDETRENYMDVTETDAMWKESAGFEDIL